MLRKSLLLAYVFLFATAALARTDEQNKAKVREIEAIVDEAMQAQQITGLSIAVVHGDFRWSRGFGIADVENEVPATADSSYRMASVSKPMTAIAILRLADEGKLDLDADVRTYVPYFPRKAYTVTVRQLLSHQGGISHYRNYEMEGRIKEPKTTREAIAIFADWDLVHEPGTKYLYSSYGFNLLGAVVEEVSKQPFGAYMAETVWKPLGMTATLMDDPRAIIPHRVDGYVRENGTLRRSEYVDISSRFGGGGTRSTVKDMIRLFEGLGEGKVLKPATREMAWTARPLTDGTMTDYALGFGIDTYKGHRVIAHTGSQQETRTSLLMIPDTKLIIALASNYEDAKLRPIMEKLMALFD
jgi:CubicO group peptidase (beta-lactamase class C family)